ncbi:MAG TPA: hypothetical protein VF618_13530 [Thermoanaerobaculia bacterium]
MRWGLRNTRVSIALLLMLAILGCQPAERPASANHDAALDAALFQMRNALRKHHAEQHRYPSSLEELVPRYLPRVPIDPFTGKADWRLILDERVTNDDFAPDAKPVEKPQIIDVKSRARPNL